MPIELRLDVTATPLLASGVAVPQRTGVIGLPAQPRVAVGAHAAGQPRLANRRCTVVDDTALWVSQPSATSVRRISGTDAAGCSRQMSSKSARCAGVSSRARPRSERAAGFSANEILERLRRARELLGRRRRAPAVPRVEGAGRAVVRWATFHAANVAVSMLTSQARWEGGGAG